MTDRIERFLVQSETVVGEWRDAYLADGTVALFANERDAEGFVNRNDDFCLRIVELSGEP